MKENELKDSQEKIVKNRPPYLQAMAIIVILWIALLTWNARRYPLPLNADYFENQITQNYNSQLYTSGDVCTSVELTQKSVNELSGYATFSDSSSKPVHVIIDPQTGVYSVN